MKCRHCKKELESVFVDLGSSPPSNAYLTEKAMSGPETWFPLRVMVCDACWLVQTEDFAESELLFSSEYAYFSGFSTSWLKHSEKYVDEMIDRFNISGSSFVVEVAANDGYLLQFFESRGVPCLGVEPTASTAAAAREKGIEVLEEFFGESIAQDLADQGRKADLTAANNVLAHVPDINDFVKGFSIILKDDGVSTFEFPHLHELVANKQFDTIYHEHFSYLSLTAVKTIFENNGLEIFDVEKLETHGGSLRVFAQKLGGPKAIEASVSDVLALEEGAGMNSLEYYSGFQTVTDNLKDAFLSFLIEAKKEGKSVAAYGAAAKGNTFMNYAGVRPDLIRFVVDRNPAKAGRFMPGSRIPIVEETMLMSAKPDYIVILPWNLRSEIIEQLAYCKEWGASFVTAVPDLSVGF